jgi:hypothetical protein
MQGAKLTLTICYLMCAYQRRKERTFKRVLFCLYVLYSFLNEIIAFRFSFKDNSSASILILYIELIAHPLYEYI